MALRHGSAQISDVFGEKLKGPAELGGLQQRLCAMALRRSSGPAELQQWPAMRSATASLSSSPLFAPSGAVAAMVVFPGDAGR